MNDAIEVSYRDKVSDVQRSPSKIDAIDALEKRQREVVEPSVVATFLPYVGNYVSISSLSSQATAPAL
mgnify:CR=1 FL=1